MKQQADGADNTLVPSPQERLAAPIRAFACAYVGKLVSKMSTSLGLQGASLCDPDGGPDSSTHTAPAKQMGMTEDQAATRIQAQFHGNKSRAATNAQKADTTTATKSKAKTKR